MNIDINNLTDEDKAIIAYLLNGNSGLDLAMIMIEGSFDRERILTELKEQEQIIARETEEPFTYRSLFDDLHRFYTDNEPVWA